MANNSVQIRKKGNLTLPVTLRRKYNVDEGDVFTLIDMGDGSFLLTPRVSKVNQLAGKVKKMLEEEDLSLEDLLNTLDDERQRYYQAHYEND